MTSATWFSCQRGVAASSVPVNSSKRGVASNTQPVSLSLRCSGFCDYLSGVGVACVSGVCGLYQAQLSGCGLLVSEGGVVSVSDSVEREWLVGLYEVGVALVSVSLNEMGVAQSQSI